MNTENNLSNTVKIANTDDILLGTPEITRTASSFLTDAGNWFEKNVTKPIEKKVDWGKVVPALGGAAGGALGSLIAQPGLGTALGSLAATGFRDFAIGGGFGPGTMESARYFPSTNTTKTTTTNTTRDSLTGMDVMRFNDQQTNAHFFTTKPSEIQDRLNNPSRYKSEGNEFDTPLENTPGAIPVYRYFNQTSQTYFYTIQPPNELIAQFPVFSNDGIAFYAYKDSQNAPAGSVPIHRFYNQEASNKAGSPVHFFTGTEQNKQAVQGLAGFNYEGPGFYAYPSNSTSSNPLANLLANVDPFDAIGEVNKQINRFF